MNIILYHGSEITVGQPIWGKGKKYNDYGLGFYCTENIDVAKEWAVDENKDGYINIYEMDLSGLTVLNLQSVEYCILHWLTVLLQNREFKTDSALACTAKKYLIDHFSTNYEEFDIIRGYRADDSYFSFAQDFLNGTISVRQLAEAMKLGRLGEQIVLKSKKSFDRIIFKNSEAVSAEEWFPKKSGRDDNARMQYRQMNKDEWQRGDIYVTHILDEEIKPDDLRLR